MDDGEGDMKARGERLYQGSGVRGQGREKISCQLPAVSCQLIQNSKFKIQNCFSSRLLLLAIGYWLLANSFPAYSKIEDRPDQVVVETSQVRLLFNKTKFQWRSYSSQGNLLVAEPQTGGFSYLTKDGKKHSLGEGLTLGKSEESVSLEYKTDEEHRVCKILIQVVNPNMVQILFTLEPQEQVMKISEEFEAQDRESFYGLNEKVSGDGKSEGSTPQSLGTLNRRGEDIRMYTAPTISIYSPFYISSMGYGVYAETTFQGNYDMGSRRPDRVQFDFMTAKLPLYFVYGPSFAQILEHYTAIPSVGRPIMPPRWVFSVWKWRDEHANLPAFYDGTPNPTPYNSMVAEDIFMMEKLDIPVGVYWVDRPWAKGEFGWDDFEVDQVRLPKFAEMVKWLHSKNIKFLLWAAPWAYGKMQDEARQLGYLAPNSKEVVDFTNPKAVEWWKKNMKKVLAAGVDGWKQDRGEERLEPTESGVWFDGRSGLEMHNFYPVLYAKVFHDAMKEHKKSNDFVIMPRAGFSGNQKYSVFWGGDTKSDFNGLRSVIISMQRSALMGFPVWGSDTGGYGTPYSTELMARWLQVSCFSPIMEVGGSGKHEPWNMMYSPSYDEKLISIYRYYAKFHTELVPYSYSHAYEAHESGHPIVRPLIYAFPDDPRVADMWDEYLYGNSFLIAPLYEEGREWREVYLPEGRWIDYWDQNRSYDGPVTIGVHANLNTLPVFIKDGALIPLEIIDGATRWAPEGAGVGKMSAFPKGFLTLAIFPGPGFAAGFVYDGAKVYFPEVILFEKTLNVNLRGLSGKLFLRIKTEQPESVFVSEKPLEKLASSELFSKKPSGWFYEESRQLLWVKVPAGAQTIAIKQQ